MIKAIIKFIFDSDFRERVRFARDMKYVRDGFAFFGYPIDHLTDQEILDGAARTANIINELKLTCAEAGKCLQLFQKAISEENR